MSELLEYVGEKDGDLRTVDRTVLVTVADRPSQAGTADIVVNDVPDVGNGEITALAESAKTSQELSQADILASRGGMRVGEVRGGITCTGEPMGAVHWLADTSASGDMIMALPASVLIAGRSAQAGGVAVDMGLFLDAIIEGAAKFEGLDGIGEAASLPMWSVYRLFGVFPVLMDVYNEAMDRAVITIEAAGMRAARGIHYKQTRTFSKTKDTPEGRTHDEGSETIDKYIPPDPTLSKLILTSRMKGRYKDTGGMKQAIQINISGAESRL